MSQRKYAVATFSNRQTAQRAIERLRKAGLLINKISIIPKEDDRDSKVDVQKIGNRSGEVSQVGAVAGGTAGGIIGLLEGIGVLLISGTSPALAMGAILTNTLLGGGIGATGGSLIGALIGWGIPAERAKFYRDRVHDGQYWVIVEGTEEELYRTRAILAARGIQDWSIYELPGYSSHF